MRLLLEDLCEQLRRLHPQAVGAVQLGGPYEQLCTEFRRVISHAAAASPAGLVLVLDGLHVLTRPHNLPLAAAMGWLPSSKELSSKLRIVLTMVPGMLKQMLAEHCLSSAHPVLQMGNLESDLSFAAIQRLLAAQSPPRRVTSDQARALAAVVRRHPTPLFLQFALHVVAQWSAEPDDESSYITQFLKAADSGPMGLFTTLCTSLERTFGNAFVRTVCRTLVATQYGMSDDEMVQILANSEAIMDELNTSGTALGGTSPSPLASNAAAAAGVALPVPAAGAFNPQVLQADLVQPRVRWLRLKQQLAWCLQTHRVADGMMVTGLRHSLVRRCMASLYSELDGGAKAIALDLLRFFDRQLKVWRSRGERDGVRVKGKIQALKG